MWSSMGIVALCGLFGVASAGSVAVPPSKKTALALPENAGLMERQGARCKVPDEKFWYFKDLTCQLLEDNAVNGTVFLAFTNMHELELSMNWARNLRKATGSQKLIIGAMDQEAYDELKAKNIPTFFMNSKVSGEKIGWGGDSFRELGRDKTRLITQVLEMDGPNFVISDADVQWLQNPLEYFYKFPEADLLISSDRVDTDRLREPKLNEFVPTQESMEARTALDEKFPSLNIGIVFFRTGREALKPLVEQWLQNVVETDVWDQQALDSLLRRDNQYGVIASLKEGSRKNILVTSQQNGPDVNWGILPATQFGSGQNYWISRISEKLGVPAYSAHADFTNWGMNGKRAKLRVAGLWEDPEDYYQGKFLAMELVIPPELLEPYIDADTQHMAPDRHIQLVNTQLKQIANAAAVAHGLGRTLILPKVKCSCEYVWYPGHTAECRFPGDLGKIKSDTIPTTMPYDCPPDQIFNMVDMDNNMPHRLSNFLEDARVQYGAKDTVLVESWEQPSIDGLTFKPPRKESELGYSEHLKVQPSQTMSALRESLKKHEDAPVMVLGPGQAEILLGGFDDPEEVKSFISTMKSGSAMWCCSDANGVRGGVPYMPLYKARETWNDMKIKTYGGSRGSRCVPNMEMEKSTNVKGVTNPRYQTGQWWGHHYPGIAMQMCTEKGDNNACGGSTGGLCKCPEGLAAGQCSDDYSDEAEADFEESINLREEEAGELEDGLPTKIGIKRRKRTIPTDWALKQRVSEDELDEEEDEDEDEEDEQEDPRIEKLKRQIANLKQKQVKARRDMKASTKSAEEVGFSKYKGFIPAGSDILQLRLSVDKAKDVCAAMSECKGFTFKGDLNDKGTGLMLFKSKFGAQGTGWTSYRKEGASDSSKKHGHSFMQLSNFGLLSLMQNSTVESQPQVQAVQLPETGKSSGSLQFVEVQLPKHVKGPSSPYYGKAMFEAMASQATDAFIAEDAQREINTQDNGMTVASETSTRIE